MMRAIVRRVASLALGLVGACSDGYPADRDDDQPAENCPDSPERETCNGEDDDCDGWADAYRVGSELLSACVCQQRPLRARSFDNGSSNATTECTIDPDGFHLDTTVNCHEGGWALCSAEATNGMEFDLAEGGHTLLEVAFELESEAALPGALNLWFQGASDRDPAPRKYLPLLQAGDAPGHYIRRFGPEAVCFPSWLSDEHACSGQASDCGACAAEDSCGAGTAGCSDFDFSRPRIQLAIEFCGGDVPYVAHVGMAELSYLSLGCLQEAGP